MCMPPRTGWLLCSAFRMHLWAELCSLALGEVATSPGRRHRLDPNVSQAQSAAEVLHRLQALPRGRRLADAHALLGVPDERGGLAGGLSSLEYKQGMLRTFGSPRWAHMAVLEVGSHNGHITAILGLTCAFVFAMEIDFFWGVTTRRGRLRTLRNVVYLTMDNSKPYAMNAIAANELGGAVIDGAHDRMHVFYDTFRVLHDVPCCIRVLVYHDYCDDEVYETVQLFVSAGVLAFREGIGEDPGTYWWCKQGRPEGGVLDVVPGDHIRERLDGLRQNFERSRQLDEVTRRLDGTTWWLPLQGLVMTLTLPPKAATVRTLSGSPRDVTLGFAVLGGYTTDFVHPRWGGSSLIGQLRSQGDAGSACGEFVFDPEVTGFTLVLWPETEGCDGLLQLDTVRLGQANYMVGMRLTYATSLLHDIHERSSSHGGNIDDLRTLVSRA